MNDEKEKTNTDKMKKNVLEKIRTGQIRMRPKIYFILQVALLILVAFLIIVASSLIASYIIFSVRISGHLFLLGFGLRGLLIFILLFPWLVFFLDIVLIFVFDRLIKRFKFGYRIPLLYLLGGTAAFALTLGFIINLTPLHRFLLERAERRNLPVIGNFYQNLRRPERDRGVFRGIVVSVQENTFTIKHDDYDIDSDEKQIKIILPPDLKAGTLLKAGDRVFVAGAISPSGEVYAFGIQKLPPMD